MNQSKILTWNWSDRTNTMIYDQIQSASSRLRHHGRLVALLPDRKVLCKDGDIMRYYFTLYGNVVYIKVCTAFYIPERISPKQSRFNLWEHECNS